MVTVFVLTERVQDRQNFVLGVTLGCFAGGGWFANAYSRESHFFHALHYLNFYRCSGEEESTGSVTAVNDGPLQNSVSFSTPVKNSSNTRFFVLSQYPFNTIRQENIND